MSEQDYASDEHYQANRAIAQEVLKLFLEKDVLLKNATFIEQIVIELFEQFFPKDASLAEKMVLKENIKKVFDIVQQSLQRHANEALEKLYGKPLDEVSVGDIEQVINPNSKDIPVEE